ncbi:hypothetical protein BDR03DRAFT_969109 [Suillus americanus]|nr:hypothetical protein BDR03DRAFT_969109 [Suillus americanus]
MDYGASRLVLVSIAIQRCTFDRGTQPETCRATPPEALKIPLALIATKFMALAPWRSTEHIDYVLPPKMTWRISKKLGDWVIHDTTEYVDHEGTLHAKLEMTLI